jgi:NAD(P)-dependent dehydrogenase (short-subunit alcohol dehydrogenase family)
LNSGLISSQYQVSHAKDLPVTKPVCLILGAGAGIGGHVAKRFAREGYHACLARRSDQAGLEKLVAEIEAEGGSASGCLLNAVEEGSIEQRVIHIEAQVGPIAVAVFNLGAQIGDRGLASTTLKQFEMGWRMATFGLFRLAQVLFPYMEQRGKGALLVTSATAAMRGNAGQHSHAAAMGGRRMLCQSLNAQFASKGIHVAHIVIDGAVDAPDTLGKMLGPERFQALREKKGLEHDGLLVPAEVANTYFHIAHQHRSAWTFELDLRAHSDLAWWNHAGSPDLR